MRLLLVEDEAKLAESLSRGLREKGYAVDTVADGDKAFTRISLHHIDYDLVILDLMLPGKDGLEICRTLREREITTPILILTARNEIDSKIHLLESGADDYMVKPFSFDELVARINAILRRPATSLPTVLTVGDLELNVNAQTASRGGKPLTMTLKEFSLLEYLMRRPGEVVSREDILSHLWDFNYESFSNVVDVHIKNLRRKIDEGKRESLLETIRGIGYRLRV